MDRIFSIDRDLKTLLKHFEKIATSIPFGESGNLLKPDEIAKHEYPGIYLIEVCTAGGQADLGEWIEKFRHEWTDERYRDKFVPNPKKKRIKAHITLQEWMPVYIGKSKRICNRLKEHVELKLDAKTFALKINERNMLNRCWRFRTINLGGVANYDVIAPQMETALRNHINPIVGQ